jgi:hexosaminidase
MIPQPCEVTERTGAFGLDGGTALVGPPDLVELARGQLPRAHANGESGTTIELGLDPSRPEEGYELDITSERLTIRGGSAAGVFYGLQTVRQLLPPDAARRATTQQAWTIPACQVVDAPALRWRGLLLDVARYHMPKRFVLDLIDLLALHKLNVLQLHLTDNDGWRFESQRYPRLTEVGAWRSESRLHGQTATDGTPHGGFYTQDDLREIVAYAASRFVTVVPEIEMPAHAGAAIRAHPGLGDATTGVLNVEDATFAFLENVLDEVLDVFPSAFVHIGGDECPKEPWRNDARAQAKRRELDLADEDELQSWFVRRIGTWLAERGRRLVGWDEILEGGLAPGATVMSWHGESGGIAAARAGHDVVMAPNVPTYFDYYQSESPDEPVAMGGLNTLERVYDYLPVPEELIGAEAEHVIGTQCALWSEFLTTPASVEYMAFPRTCAFAEVAWHNGKPERYERFRGRLERHLELLDTLGVNYRPLDGPRPWQRGGTGRFRRPPPS